MLEEEFSVEVKAKPLDVTVRDQGPGYTVEVVNRECHGFVNPHGLRVRVGRGTGAGWQV
jgi:hypothetical protein